MLGADYSPNYTSHASSPLLYKTYRPGRAKTKVLFRFWQLRVHFNLHFSPYPLESQHYPIIILCVVSIFFSLHT